MSTRPRTSRSNIMFTNAVYFSNAALYHGHTPAQLNYSFISLVPHLQVVLSIGGAASAEVYADVAADPVRRDNFAQSVHGLVEAAGLLQVAACVDLVNLAAYDLYGLWSSRSGHHAQLYSTSTSTSTSKDEPSGSSAVL